MAGEAGDARGVDDAAGACCRYPYASAGAGCVDGRDRKYAMRPGNSKGVGLAVLVWRCWSGGVGLPWRTRYGSCFGLCEFVERWEVVLEAEVVGDAEDAEDCGGVADGELDVGLGEKAG
jgi:hypothetical protein